MTSVDDRSTAGDKAVVVLDVFLHDRRVGTITRLPNESNVFVFDEAYIEDEARPTLSLSFKRAGGELLTNVKPRHVKLPPFFSNLLPEGKLRELLAEKGNINEKREFFLLRLLGDDLPGALSVRSTTEDDSRGDYGSGDDGVDGEVGDRGKNVLKFSLAGVQLKFSAVENAHGGLTIPARGVGGFWIVKLPSAHYPAVPQNEFAMMTLAKAAGMDVPDLRLVPMDSISGLPQGIGKITGQALAVRRFDRATDGKRVHTEDFAQVFGVYPDQKYQNASYRNIAQVIYTEAGEESMIEFVRRIIFNALIGNGDMHLKNWSLLYTDGNQANLSPAYDFVATVPYIPGDRMALGFMRTKKFEDLSIERLKKFAAKALLPETMVLRTVSDTVERTIEAWSELEEADMLPNDIRTAVSEHMEKIGELLRS